MVPDENAVRPARRDTRVAAPGPGAPPASRLHQDGKKRQCSAVAETPVLLLLLGRLLLLLLLLFLPLFYINANSARRTLQGKWTSSLGHTLRICRELVERRDGGKEISRDRRAVA